MDYKAIRIFLTIAEILSVVLAVYAIYTIILAFAENE